MRVALLLERLLDDLKEWGVPKPLLTKVQDLYRAAYREGYEDAQEETGRVREEREEDEAW